MTERMTGAYVAAWIWIPNDDGENHPEDYFRQEARSLYHDEGLVEIDVDAAVYTVHELINDQTGEK
jgi:hypothetical protein